MINHRYKRLATPLCSSTFTRSRVAYKKPNQDLSYTNAQLSIIDVGITCLTWMIYKELYLEQYLAKLKYKIIKDLFFVGLGLIGSQFIKGYVNQSPDVFNPRYGNTLIKKEKKGPLTPEESKYLDQNTQTLWSCPSSGHVIIPKDKEDPSLYRRQGNYAHVKAVNFNPIGETTWDSDSPLTVIENSKESIEQETEYVRLNIRLIDAEHYSRLNRGLALLSDLPDDICSKPIASMTYTGKKGAQKVKLIAPKMMGDLFNAILDKDIFDSEEELTKLAAQIILILYQVEDVHDIYHRDIKLENFLYRSDDMGRVYLQLTDFEFARNHIEDGKMLGTPHYVAPEILIKPRSQPTNLSDVWSAGVMLSELETKSQFIEGSTLKEVTEELKTLTQEKITQRLAKTQPPAMKNLLHKMIVPDVSERYSFTDLLQDPFILKGLQLLQQEQHTILQYVPIPKSTQRTALSGA